MQLPIASARFVAVSATIPNVQDIAEWLGADPKRGGLHVFGEDHRPVRLVTHVRGYAMTKVCKPAPLRPRRKASDSSLREDMSSGSLTCLQLCLQLKKCLYISDTSRILNMEPMGQHVVSNGEQLQSRFFVAAASASNAKGAVMRLPQSFVASQR